MSGFAGVGRILHFNWPFYAGAVLSTGIAVWLLIAWPAAASWRWPVIAGLVLTNGWVSASLLVSHAVYDRSAVPRGDWLPLVLPRGPVRSVAVLHFGHDEVSAAVTRRLPGIHHLTLDLYDPSHSGSPSLRRARAARRGATDEAAPLDHLPLDNGTVDLAVLAFAAHEVRDRDARTALFGEVARVIGLHGRAIVLEHLRDGWNLLAYGPGALHFLSRSTWLATFAAAGLVVTAESPVTPWVRRFELASRGIHGT
jgi:hypothetical protein